MKLEDEDEAIEALRLAKKNESDSHSETKKRLKELQDKLDELTNEDHRKRGDVEALENSWKEKLSKRETELMEQINMLQNSAIKSTKDSILSGLASKYVKPEYQRMFKKDIEDRIEVQLENGSSAIRILGSDGKPSALTMEDFEKEILANKEYAPIVIANRASGGAKIPVTPAGGQETALKPFSRMTPGELKAQIDAKGEN